MLFLIRSGLSTFARLRRWVTRRGAGLMDTMLRTKDASRSAGWKRDALLFIGATITYGIVWRLIAYPYRYFPCDDIAFSRFSSMQTHHPGVPAFYLALHALQWLCLHIGGDERTALLMLMILSGSFTAGILVALIRRLTGRLSSAIAGLLLYMTSAWPATYYLMASYAPFATLLYTLTFYLFVVVFMDRRLLGRDEARAHVDAVCAQRQRRDQRTTICHAARCDERDLEFLGCPRQQYEIRDVVLSGMPAALEAVHADSVAADRLRLQRVPHRGALVDHLDAGRVQVWHHLLGVAARGLDDLHAALDDGPDVPGVVGRGYRGQERDIDAEGLVGHLAAAPDFLGERLGRLLGEAGDDAEAACVRYRCRQLGETDVMHAALDDGVLDSKEFGDTGPHVILPPRCSSVWVLRSSIAGPPGNSYCGQYGGHRSRWRGRLPDHRRRHMESSKSLRRGSGRLCAAVLLATLASTGHAQTYSVDLRPTLHDLDVKVEPVAMSGMLVIKLTNNTSDKVRCELRYDASPQPLYRTTVYVGAGKTEQNAFRQKRTWFSIAVDVECQLADRP